MEGYFVEYEPQCTFAHLHQTSSLILVSVLREAERKNDDVFEDLPLFVIEEQYGGSEAGRREHLCSCIKGIVSKKT